MIRFRGFVAVVVASILICTQCAAQSDVFGGLAELAQQRAFKKAQGEIAKRVGEAVGLGSPILLNERSAFAATRYPEDFRPRLLRLRSIDDLRRPLPPGDYSIAVTGYCSQHSMHAPATGIPYKLAPLEGKQAKSIGTLMLRLTAARVNPSEIQAMLWRLGAGVPVSEMSDGQRAAIHRFAPEYERALDADVLQTIENTYNKFRLVPSMPSLESLLSQSDAGRIVLNLRRARRILADQTISAENLPERLFEISGDGTPWRLDPSTSPHPSPWSVIRPGVIARFTIEQGFSGTNLLEFRISDVTARKKLVRQSLSGPLVFGFVPQADSAVSAAGAFISVSQILGVVFADVGATAAAAATNPLVIAAAAGGLLIAYSIGQSAQPLTLLPQMYDGAGDEDNFPPPPILTTGNSGRPPAASTANDEPDGSKRGVRAEGSDEKKGHEGNLPPIPQTPGVAGPTPIPPFSEPPDGKKEAGDIEEKGDRIIQRGGNKISNGTARALNRFFGKNLERREWGRALEALKKDHGLRNDYHGAIKENGRFINADTGEVIANIRSYLP